MILLELVEGVLEPCGQVVELCLLLGRKLEQVAVIGAPTVLMRVDPVLDTVKTGHKDRRIAEIRVAGGVGVAELEPAELGRLGIRRDADDRAAVGSRIADSHGSLKAGDQTLEGVGGGIRDGAKGADMLQQAAHEPMRLAAEVGIAVIVGEYGLAVL